MKFNKIQHQLIIGSMLGDGHMELHPHCKSPNLRICRSLRDLSYLQWEASKLTTFITPAGVKNCSYFDKRTNKIYYSCRFSTISTPLFMPYYKVWYKDKIKILPDTLELTPLIMAIWFADDGNLFGMKDYKRKKHVPHRMYVKLSTHCFTLEENHRLCDILNQRYNCNKFRVNNNPIEHYIYCGSVEPTKLFLREIDSVFPPMNRKSDIWRKPEAKLYWDKPKIKCKFCQGETYKNGTVKGVQKYLCKNCKRQFIVHNDTSTMCHYEQ
jgi:hypothetical protein